MNSSQTLLCHSSTGSFTYVIISKNILGRKAARIEATRSCRSYQYSQDVFRIIPIFLFRTTSDGCFSIRTGTAFRSNRNIDKCVLIFRRKISNLSDRSSVSSTNCRIFRNRTYSCREVSVFSSHSSSVKCKAGIDA